jgi:hypothetical protein
MYTGPVGVLLDPAQSSHPSRARRSFSSLQEVPDGPLSLNLKIVKCKRRHGR